MIRPDVGSHREAGPALVAFRLRLPPGTVSGGAPTNQNGFGNGASDMSTQTVLIEVGALLLLTSTLVLVRRRLLSIRYGLGWLTVSLAGVVAGPLLSVFATNARTLGFTPTGFSLGILILFLLLLCLQLSVSLSGLHRAIRELGEHAALLEERVRKLETSGRDDGDPAPEDYARLGAPE
jgi:hypothetical protein